MTSRASAHRAGLLSIAALTALLLVDATACSGSSGANTATNPPVPTSALMTPGMTMPDGSIMGGPAITTSTTSSATPPATAGPSQSAAMVCAPELRNDLAEALAVGSIPPGRPTWQNSLYTCTYDLFGGRLVLSVKDLPSAAATDTYFAAHRHSLPSAHTLNGLTAGAFGDGAAIVVVRKDDHVLTVDARSMPAVFGSQANKRADFAYEVAAVVLGCWTEG